MLGLLLVLAGVALLLAQVVHVDLGHYAWPLFIIVPGVALLIIAVSSRGFAGEGLAILGSLLTITGLILLFQKATDHFESWAYAWALVFPGAVGIGMIIYGTYAGRSGNVRAGARGCSASACCSSCSAPPSSRASSGSAAITSASRPASSRAW
ncbi:MAG TPA: hypothetical protein VIT43_13440 [Candidatus Dormibacteraeota bacterium]